MLSYRASVASLPIGRPIITQLSDAPGWGGGGRKQLAYAFKYVYLLPRLRVYLRLLVTP